MEERPKWKDVLRKQGKDGERGEWKVVDVRNGGNSCHDYVRSGLLQQAL